MQQQSLTYDEILIAWGTKIRLNAILTKLNPRKLNKPIKFIIKAENWIRVLQTLPP